MIKMLIRGIGLHWTSRNKIQKTNIIASFESNLGTVYFYFPLKSETDSLKNTFQIFFSQSLRTLISWIGGLSTSTIVKIQATGQVNNKSYMLKQFNSYLSLIMSSHSVAYCDTRFNLEISGLILKFIIIHMVKAIS